jgi:hypothetical protein
MKKLLLFLLASLLLYNAEAQISQMGPVEKALTDSVCNCMTAVDLNKVSNKKDAMTVITDCFGKRTDLLMKVADEKHVNPADHDAMKQIGIDIGKDIMNGNCTAFLKISEKLLLDGDSKIGGSDGSTNGKLKRIDIKGFNYIVLTDNNNNEKSFIWLRQFPDSEKFMSGVTALAGKKVKINWHELEVYLPLAKGYYKVKEITSVEFL